MNNIIVTNINTEVNQEKRKGRKLDPRYIGFSRELYCTQEGCSNKQPQHPSITIKQAQKVNQTFEVFVNNWKCKVHRPFKPHHLSIEARRERGESVLSDDPRYAGIPKKAACKKCGNMITLVPSNILDKATKMGITTIELVNNYLCRKCGGRIKHNIVEKEIAEIV